MPFSLILSSTRSTSAATGSASARRRGRSGVDRRATLGLGGAGLHHHHALDGARRRVRAPARERLHPEEEVAEGDAADVRQVGDAVVRGEESRRARRAPTSTVTSVRAWIGIGIGKTISSASGQNIAKASATPSTAPEAPTNGPTGMIAGEAQREDRRARPRSSR